MLGTKYWKPETRNWLLVIRHEAHRDRVHTVARIARRVALAAEDMTEMAAAIAARYLDATSIGVKALGHGAFDRQVETRPTAACVELVGRLIERRSTTATNERTLFVEFLIFPAERRFRALMDDYALFFGCQGLELHDVPPVFLRKS
jgi:hypothetical protein